MSATEKQYEVEWYYDADGDWTGTEANKPRRRFARSPEAAIKAAFDAEELHPGEVYVVRELGEPVSYKIAARRVTIKIEEGE